MASTSANVESCIRAVHAPPRHCAPTTFSPSASGMGASESASAFRTISRSWEMTKSTSPPWSASSCPRRRDRGPGFNSDPSLNCANPSVSGWRVGAAPGWSEPAPPARSRTDRCQWIISNRMCRDPGALSSPAGDSGLERTPSCPRGGMGPDTTEPHRLPSVRFCFKRESAIRPEGASFANRVLAISRTRLCGAGGNRTRVLRRRTRASPGAVSAVVFSASALPLTRRRQAQPQKSPAQSSWPGL